MRKLMRGDISGIGRVITKLFHIRKYGLAGVGETLLRVESLNDGAVAQDLELYRNSASPAASDDLFNLSYYGRDSAANKQLYAEILARILDPTTTTEDAELIFRTVLAGAVANRLRIGGGVYTEGATGGDKGVGTINAETLYMAGSRIPFSKEFISANQTITSAGALTLAHSLGVQPKLIQVWLECQTGEFNYSAGDDLVIGSVDADGTRSGVSVVPDATNLNIRYNNQATVFTAPNKTTGAQVALTNGNWRAIFKAWA